MSGLALLYGGWVLVLWMSNDSHLVAGWSSTIVIVSLLCGMNMLMTGIVGLYVGRIHAEVKRRPLYVVQKRLGFERDQAAPAHPATSRRARMSAHMTELFDSYRSNYRDVVQSSIDFSGLPHSFFMRAKADLLRELIARAARAGKARHARCRLRRRQLSSLAARHGRPPERYRRFLGQHRAGARRQSATSTTAPSTAGAFRSTTPASIW